MTIRLNHATTTNQSTNACERLTIDHLPPDVGGSTQALMLTGSSVPEASPALPPLCRIARGSQRVEMRAGAGGCGVTTHGNRGPAAPERWGRVGPSCPMRAPASCGRVHSARATHRRAPPRRIAEPIVGVEWVVCGYVDRFAAR